MLALVKMEFNIPSDGTLDDLFEHLNDKCDGDVTIILSKGIHRVSRDLCFPFNLTILSEDEPCAEVSYTHKLGSFPRDNFECSGQDSGPFSLSVCDNSITVASDKDSPDFECLECGQTVSYYDSSSDMFSEYCVKNVCKSSITVEQTCICQAGVGDTLIINPQSKISFDDNSRINVGNLTISGVELGTEGSGIKSVFISAHNITISSVFLRGINLNMSGFMRNVRTSALYSSLLTVGDVSTLHGNHLTFLGNNSSLVSRNSRVSTFSTIFVGARMSLDISEGSSATINHTTIYNSEVGINVHMSTAVLLNSTILSTTFPIISLGSIIIIPDRSEFVTILNSTTGFRMLSSSSLYIQTKSLMMRNVQNDITLDNTSFRHSSTVQTMGCPNLTGRIDLNSMSNGLVNNTSMNFNIPSVSGNDFVQELSGQYTGSSNINNSELRSTSGMLNTSIFTKPRGNMMNGLDLNGNSNTCNIQNKCGMNGRNRPGLSSIQTDGQNIRSTYNIDMGI